MKNSEAIIELMREARAGRRSQAAVTRVLRICRGKLGLPRDEVFAILHYLDYCQADGQPWAVHTPDGYGKEIKPVWLEIKPEKVS